MHRPAPAVPRDPVIEIDGDSVDSFIVPVEVLSELPRQELSADFHCVSGWSATGLRWEGVPFAAFFQSVIEPALRPGTPVRHIVFGGLDGYRSVAIVQDVLAEDVLLAEHLDGRTLTPDHGAPVRLVSPNQYGFVSTKHLCRIELHSVAPAENYGHASAIARLGLHGPLFQRHPRARVWHEERHRYLPGWSMRPLYRLLIPPIAFLSARGSRPEATQSRHDR